MITKTSIDLKNTNGYNRAVYINKLNHLDRLPTTSIVLTESALKKHVGNPISVAEFKDLADEMNNDDDNMQVSVESQVGILIVESQPPAEAMHKLIRQWRDQSNGINGAWSVPVFPSEDVKFINISSINESNGAANGQDEDLYEQVKKTTNDPEYERQIDNRIEEAYANKLQYGNLFREEDFTVYPELRDDTNKQIERAKKLISEISQGNTAKFVSTTTTNTITTVPEKG